MNIAILGFDIEGKASYAYYAERGHTLTICDQNDAVEVPSGARTQLGADYLQNLDRFDLLIRTPGLHPRQILESNPGVAPKIWSGTNEFMKVCPSKNIIGITGTKGKGTTSTLVHLILRAAGLRAHLGGNIGRAALDLLPEIKPTDWVVLELSNFQLIDLQHSPHIAACLMVVPEHLDWHADFAEYAAAKATIMAHQNRDNVAVYYPKNETSSQISSRSIGKRLPYMESPGAYIEGDWIVLDGHKICAASDIKLLGPHNLQNICAAVTIAWQVTQNIGAIASVLSSFTGLEHRLEYVREVQGVTYYNDSFGTTPETAIVALEAFAQPKVIVLGGSDKGVAFDRLAQAVTQNNVRKVILIGETASNIQSALEKAGYIDFVNGGSSMHDIVAAAVAHTRPGDIVLLSTGCASFGLFNNYKDRGNQFKQVVRDL